jgi:5-carboxymethyl-2-hydroxymuconate isomerase
MRVIGFIVWWKFRRASSAQSLSSGLFTIGGASLRRCEICRTENVRVAYYDSLRKWVCLYLKVNHGRSRISKSGLNALLVVTVVVTVEVTLPVDVTTPVELTVTLLVVCVVEPDQVLVVVIS